MKNLTDFKTTVLDENWQTLLSLFPTDWRELARKCGAVTRARGFKTEEELMRTLLLHLARGYSLRETVVRAKAAGLADFSDVALLKRLRNSSEWFEKLSCSLFKESGLASPKSDKGFNIRLVDATNVKEPGKTGSLWRIHFSLQVPSLKCDYFKLTGTKGKGTGESFKHLPVSKNDCIIGDRGYSTADGINYVRKKGGYSLLRVNSQSLPLYSKNRSLFDKLSALTFLTKVNQICEWNVWVKDTQGQFIKGRLCAVRKTEHAIELAVKKLRSNASKKQIKLKSETLEFAKYILVYTTLPKNKFSTFEILEWYRVRWQIELIFKRLKTLAGLGHLPKYDDVSSKAWLHGKLFVGLLTEKLIRFASDISPWGYELANKTTTKSLA